MKAIHKTVHINPVMFLDIVIANAGIAIIQGVNGDEVFPVNSIQIVK
ncbi:MAG: hypothetical protein P8L23_05325 [Flavobacteriales bacterium]|nr:hypothetical protein [Flavobacteriales bacterium]